MCEAYPALPERDGRESLDGASGLCFSRRRWRNLRNLAPLMLLCRVQAC